VKNVKVQHIRKAGMCVKGARAVCEKYGYDWRTFCTRGYPVDEIKKIDDAMVQRLCEVAERE
jgi:hypothetical protein